MNGQGSISYIYAFSRHFYPNRLTKKRINIQATHKDLSKCGLLTGNWQEMIMQEYDKSAVEREWREGKRKSHGN